MTVLQNFSAISDFHNFSKMQEKNLEDPNFILIFVSIFKQLSFSLTLFAIGFFAMKFACSEAPFSVACFGSYTSKDASVR